MLSPRCSDFQKLKTSNLPSRSFRKLAFKTKPGGRPDHVDFMSFLLAAPSKLVGMMWFWRRRVVHVLVHYLWCYMYVF